jgi:hypothetical protein
VLIATHYPADRYVECYSSNTGGSPNALSYQELSNDYNEEPATEGNRLWKAVLFVKKMIEVMTSIRILLFHSK